MGNHSSVSKVFDIVFVPSSIARQGARTPKLGGRYLLRNGQIQIYSTHIRILQNSYGWTYYLGYLLGPIGHFLLSPVLGSLTYGTYTHKMQWKNISNLGFDPNSGEIQLRGIQDEGHRWLWTFKCVKDQLLLQRLSSFIKLEGFEAPSLRNGTSGAAISEAKRDAVCESISRDLLLDGLERIAYYRRKNRPIPDGKSALIWLSEELDVSPFRTVEELIAIHRDDPNGKTLIKSVGLNPEVEFYELLFDVLRGSAHRPATGVETENKPILTWAAEERVADALGRLYESSDKARYLIKNILTNKEKLRLVDKLLEARKTPHNAIEDILHRLLRRTGIAKKLWGVASTLFLSLMLLVISLKITSSYLSLILKALSRI